MGQKVDIRVVDHDIRVNIEVARDTTPLTSTSTPAPSSSAHVPSPSVSSPAPSPSSVVIISISKGVIGKLGYIILTVVADVAY
ncbi:hypothetical protein MKX03_004694 [Papaver bracteatum]|nr:hypothetical protein MKX03_004694 [Papaver bracteatum]